VGLPTSICWCVFSIDPLLLGHIRKVWCQAALWEILEHVLYPTYCGDYCLSCGLSWYTTSLQSTVSSTAATKAFEFHVNLSFLNIAVSSVLWILKFGSMQLSYENTPQTIFPQECSAVFTAFSNSAHSLGLSAPWCKPCVIVSSPK
jgi:hypothetical protein